MTVVDASVVVALLLRTPSAARIEARLFLPGETLLADLPIRRYAHDLLLPRTWQLRHNLSAYDATYVVLAELLDASFLTCDRRLAAAPVQRARIELIGT